MASADPRIRARVASIGGKTAYAKHGSALIAKAQVARQTTLRARLAAENGLDLTTEEGQHRLQAAVSAYYGSLSLKRKRFAK